MVKKLVILIVLAFACSFTMAQGTKLELNGNGTIKYVVFPNKGCDTLKFHAATFSGPSLLVDGQRLVCSRISQNTLAGQTNDLKYYITHSTIEDKLVIKIDCQNIGKTTIDKSKLTLNLGINTTMSHYPEWRSAYFPTLFRLESSHLWGYLMSPNGGIITITSPDPIGSYELYYNNDKQTHSFGHGHLIPSFGLDLLNPSPLPSRYGSEQKNTLKAGQKRSWTIYLGATTDLRSVISRASKDANAPIITADFYTIEPNNEIALTVFSPKKPTVEIITPNGIAVQIRVKQVGDNQFRATYAKTENHGLYNIVARANNKKATSSVNVRHNWSDYAKSARRAAIKYPQKAGSHTESWYGLFSGYVAAEIFPNQEQDDLIESKFQELYPLIHDTITNLPTTYATRIQNSALMAALLAQKYKAQQNISDLRRAASILDFLMTKQSADGAYRNGKTHYTSVIYIAKAFMEVMQEEKVLAQAGSQEWQSNYKRHFHSVKRAIDDLSKNLDNIDTEGELTYEDGMISCSYSQIAMFALLYAHGSPEREQYTKAAENMARGHRTLSQLLVPDARMNGASLRYWEAQYDILTFPNMMNSPHGWSAWRIYGLKYLYLLTSKEEYLIDMINAMGTCAQLLDPTTDKLNWAFVVDPCLNVEQFVEDKDNAGKGKYIKTTISEQYMPMISDWYRAADNTWVTGYWGADGGCCDNDVHEIFKCMGEVALTSAYAHRRTDNSLILWNCTAKQTGTKLIIEPLESCITTLYTNTETETKIKNTVKI